MAPRGTLDERSAFANSAGADLFVSIHINAGGGHGYESHIHPNASGATLAIAESIHTTLASWYGERGHFDRGLKRSNFAVLRETKMPAILLENLFIDNAEDAAFLKDNLPAIGNEIAWAIAYSIKLKAKTQPVDPCKNCQKILALDMELRRLRQVIKQAGATLAPEMV